MAFRQVAGHTGATGYTFDPDAWVELAYPSRQKRKIYDSDGQTLEFLAEFSATGFERMLGKFRLAKLRNPHHCLLVNIDHLANQPDQKTEAAAWLVDLMIQDEHLYGKFRWTALGEEMALGGIYRFVSVEVDCERIPRSKWVDRGVVWDTLLGVAITNDHALKDLKPISYRAEDEVENEPQPKGTNMDTIKELLGLDADATQEQIAESIKALHKQIETLAAAQAEAKIAAGAEAFRAAYGDRFKDDESAVAFYRANPEQASALADSIKVVEEQKPASTAPVAYRRAKTPDTKVEDKTPLGIYRKWKGMNVGAERDAFFAVNIHAINEGASLAEDDE